jgi:putative ABC transport system ATP-binding protein
MLDLNNVCKTFNVGTVNEKCALNSVDLHLEDGDFVTVIGSNGAGKSTLLNAVAGTWPVDSRAASSSTARTSRVCPTISARACWAASFRIPMIGTAATMEIEENLALAARRGKAPHAALGITPAEREELPRAAQGARPRPGGPDDVKVGLLSGGQRQALTLLMATLQRPKLLLLDEHTAALDPKTAAKVLELSDRGGRGRNKLTTLMMTHNMKDAIRHGNRLIMMNDGKIILDISGEEKKQLTKADLLQKFAEVSGNTLENDRVLLS